jgi:hypothetical protein
LRQVVDYFTGLFVCLAAFAGYQIFAAPFLVPHDLPPLPEVKEQPMVVLDPEVAALFPAGAWQLNASHQVSAETGTFLYEKSEQLAPNKWRLFPVTMLVQRGPSERTILIDAAEGVVEFSGSLDSLDSGSSPITNGHLAGTVKVYSPPTRITTNSISPEFADNALYATARDVRINRREIRTTESVELKYGSMLVKGRDLTIHLSGSLGRSTDAILERMELIYLEYLEIPLKEGGLWQPLASAKPLNTGVASRSVLSGVGSRNDGQPTARLSMVCQGKLDFHFESLLLLLSGSRVQLTHQIEGYAADNVLCKRLEVQFARADKTVVSNSRHRVRRLVAQGTVEQPVILDAPSMISSGRAESIEVNFPVDGSEAVLELRGERPVELAHRGLTLEVPDLEYHFSQTNPEQVGTLRCKSPGGQLKLQPSDSLPLRQLRWQGKLQLSPLKGMHRLWIPGNVEGETIDGGLLRAEEIQYLFSVQTNPENPSAATEIFPRRLTLKSSPSVGNVKVDLPWIYLEQKEIDLFFEPGTTSSGSVAATRGPPLLGLGNPEPNEQLRKPSRIVSESLYGQIQLTHGEVSGFDLSARRNIRLETEISGTPSPSMLASARQPLPLVVTGEELRAIHLPSKQTLEISGQPAKIELADGFAEGPRVFANVHANRLELDRGGEVRIPQAWLAPQGSVSSQSLEWTIAPHLRFRGPLVFDGRILEATQVDLHGALRDSGGPIWQFATQGQILQVGFKQPISFLDWQLAQANVVDRVVLAGETNQVIVDGSSWRGEARESRHWFQTSHLVYMPDTGMLHGAPGEYRLWSLRENAQGGTMPSFFGTAPMVTSHLIYHQELIAMVPQKKLEFRRAVRVATGPANSWDQSIDVRRLEQPLLGQGILDCDRLTVAPSLDASGRQADVDGWEIQGDGGVGGIGVDVHAESGRFKAKGDRFRYMSDKDLLVLDGRADAPVEISSLPGNAGAFFGSGTYSSISVRPRKLEIADAQPLQATIQVGPPQAPSSSQASETSADPVAGTRSLSPSQRETRPAKTVDSPLKRLPRFPNPLDRLRGR